MFKARVVLDSIAPCRKRLISVEATYPRFIHSELLTHRAFARNSASSRAIPWSKTRKKFDKETSSEYTMAMTSGDPKLMLDDKCMMHRILTNPVIPISFDAEQKGMQSGDTLSEMTQASAREIWLNAMDDAVMWADKLANLGVHKSLVNRLTEPFMWITVIVTATEWNNFFRLRCHPAAEKHFQRIAGMMRDVINASKPQELYAGDWHCPYLTVDEQHERRDAFAANNQVSLDILKKSSVARCARVSYLTHDSTIDQKADLRLVGKLLAPPGETDEDIMHASPFEHVGQAHEKSEYRSGPFFGWGQFRKEFPNENKPD